MLSQVELGWKSCRGREGPPPQIPPASGAQEGQAAGAHLAGENAGGFVCPTGVREALGQGGHESGAFQDGQDGSGGEHVQAEGEGVEEGWERDPRMHSSKLFLK